MGLSVKYISAVWENQHIGEQSTLLVMLALADFSNDQGWSWPSIPTLAEKARISDRHVRRILKALEQAKVLEVEHRNGRNHTNRYRLTLPICPVLFTLTSAETLTSESEKGTPESVKQDITCPINRQEPSVKSNQKQKQGVEVPIWISPETWEDFREMRVKIKKPMTARAERGIFKRLDEFRGRGMPVEEILEQSIVNGWQDVYEIKKQGNGNGTRAQQNQDASRENILSAVNSRLAQVAEQGDGIRPRLLRSDAIDHGGHGGDLVAGVGEAGDKERAR